MIIVVLGVLAAIASLAWIAREDRQTQMRRVPIRVRDKDRHRRNR